MIVMPAGRGMFAAGKGAAYTGPGDVVSGAAFWGGLRAYSTATIGDNAIRIRRSSDNTEADVITLADGSLDVASVSTFIGGGNAFVHTIYDQSGNSRDSVAASNAAQPQLILSGLGSLPVMRFTYNAHSLQSAGSVTRAQPLTHSAVAKRTSDTGSYHGILSNGTHGTGFSNGANAFLMFAGSLPTAVAADNTMHTFQAAFDGTSSVAYVDGGSTSMSPGTTALTGVYSVGAISGSGFGGDMCEVGEWLSKFDATQAGNMDANQAAYWGI